MEGPSEKEVREANARALAASNDLGCMDCDRDRPFKPLRYRVNRTSGKWELLTWRLLDNWKGHFCHPCQAKRNKAEAVKLEALAKKQKLRIAVAEKDGKNRAKQRALELRDFLDAIRTGEKKVKV